jgi:LysM repeat protein
MDDDTALSSWIIFLLIALGVALAVGIALLLTQLDALQQQTLLPQATLPVIDVEATLSAGDLTVVVIAGDDSQSGTPTSTPTQIRQIPDQSTIESTSAPVIVPTCAAAPDEWTPHTVQEGDSLSALSLQLGVGVDLLLQANCLTQSQLIPGQIILLPSFQTPTLTVAETCSVPSGWVPYIVKPGDTLTSLAEKHRSTVGLLMQANCLGDTRIIPGRELSLPPIPIQEPTPRPGMPVSPELHELPGWPARGGPATTPPVWPTKMVNITPDAPLANSTP